jgi:hypothetical protein
MMVLKTMLPVQNPLILLYFYSSEVLHHETGETKDVSVRKTSNFIY